MGQPVTMAGYNGRLQCPVTMAGYNGQFQSGYNQHALPYINPKGQTIFIEDLHELCNSNKDVFTPIIVFSSISKYFLSPKSQPIKNEKLLKQGLKKIP
jgi:hypothetical protein